MIAPPLYGPTDGLFVGASELFSVDPNFLNGQRITPKAGDRIPFEAASFQARGPLVQLRWVTAEDLRVKPNTITNNGSAYTITLRDRDGRFIVEDLPVMRLAELQSSTPLNVAITRNLVWDPVFVDWRRSFIRNLTGRIDPLYFMAIYQYVTE